MIIVRNTQRTVPVNKKWVSATAQKILDCLDYADFDWGIWITNDKTIRKYNKQFRHVDKATDILSFAYHDTLKAGARIKPQNEEDKNIGDIIISAPYVLRESERYNVSFNERLETLLIHGACHLLGYDHETDQDYKRMQKKEAFILKKITNN